MSKKLVYGVGINDADYKTREYITVEGGDGKKKQKVVWRCPFYSRWQSMLTRCYSHKLQEKHPTYIGCYVCDDWLTFSKFKQWMEKQEWEGKQLDKDILYPQNKLYSPETCVFVDGRVNNFVTESNSSRGQWMIGVHWYKAKNKFQALCNDGSGKTKHLGYFDTELEAHQAWLKCKQEVALELAAEQTDPRIAKALIERYENYVAQEKELNKS